MRACSSQYAHDLATPNFAIRKNGMVEKEEESETRHVLR